MAEVKWTEHALADLSEIAEYVALDKPDAAAALVRKALDHVEKLASHPKLGSRIPELLPDSRFRQIVEAPCRIFYRYDEAADACYILSTIRGERLFDQTLLLERPSGMDR